MLYSAILSLILMPLSFAQAQQSDLEGIKAADYRLEKAHFQVVIGASGTYTMTEKVSFRVQNENGRTYLGLRELKYGIGSAIEVLDAYTLTDIKKTPTDLKLVVSRSTSEGTEALKDEKKLIIPFNNVMVGSSVAYTAKTTMSKPLIPGVASMAFAYGQEFPEQNETVEIFSEKPIRTLVMDQEKLLTIVESKEGKFFKVSIELKQPVYRLPALRRMSLVPTGYIPMVLISTASSWAEIVKPIVTPYEAAANAPLPPEFQKIVTGAANLKTDSEKLNYVTSEVSRIIAYSGNWTTQSGQFFPKGHAKVVSDGKGDCKDFATSVTGILRKMGYDSSVALVSSSDPRYRSFKDVELNKFVPSMDYFNHAISMVKLSNGKIAWLDATHPTPNAEGIWPELSGSPALPLKADAQDVIRIPEDDGQPSKTKIKRTVTVASADKAEWKGEYKSTGSTALQILQLEKNLGEEKFSSVLPMILLQNNIIKDSKFKLPVDSFNAKESKLEFNFDLVGEVPIEEMKDKSLELILPTDRSASIFFMASKESGAYFGPLGSKEIVTTYMDITVDDPIDGECFILSPWYDYQRSIEVEGNKTVISEISNLKKSQVSAADANKDNYSDFLADVRGCFTKEAIAAQKPTSAQEAKPEIKISNNKTETPSKIRLLPITKDSAQTLKSQDIQIDPQDFHYSNLKLKKIYEKVLEADPNNLEARARRARKILDIGYLVGDKYQESYLQYALNELTSVLTKDPALSIARYNRATIYLSLKKPDEALTDAGAGYTAEPENAANLVRMAEAYIAKKDYKLAETWLASAKGRCKTVSDQTLYWTAHSKLGSETKDYGKQLVAFEEIYKLKPNSPWAAHNLAIAYGEIKQFDKAIELSRKALSIMDFGAARNHLGMMLEEKAWLSIKSTSPLKASVDRELEKTLIEANKYRPEAVFSYENLTRIYIKRTEAEHESDWLDKADIYLNEGLKRFPDDKRLLDLAKHSQATKEFLMKYFNSQGVKPTGRWPASFQNSKAK